MNEVKNVRALWKGSLSFGLVTIPVAIYAAARDYTSPLHQYRKGDLSPIQYKKVGRDGKEVPYTEIVKGLEIEKGRIVSLSDDELAALEIESEKLIDIDCFVDAKEIDIRHFEKPYFLQADKGGQKGYNLLFNVLKNTNKIGIAKVALRKREYLVAVGAHTGFNLLTLEVLRWSHELVQPDLTKADSNVSKEELKLATMLVDGKTSTFQPEKYKDLYVVGLEALIAEKSRTGKVTKKAKADKPKSNVVAPDMVAILNESMKNIAKRGKYSGYV
jgi:DNA end-binding protein Ku